MNQIDEMDDTEITALLQRVGYGHLACSDQAVPYVVPVHYVFDGLTIYVYTTEGKKQEIIARNPNVCLQVENVESSTEWSSVLVIGTASVVTDRQEREVAVKLLTQRNPTLSPAISVRWMDNWVRENREVILRIDPTVMTGRRSHGLYVHSAKVRPKFCL